MKHLIIVGILVAIFSVLVSVLLGAIGLLPIQASAQAVTIDRLFDLHFKLIAFLFSLIMVLMLYSIVVFRRKPGETGDGKHIEGNTPLELAWTVVPLIAVIYIAYLGAGSLAETRRVDPQAMVVKVTARQWSWSFEYPEYNITSSTLNLPVDKQVLLQLTSLDVLHGFWVPEFRLKQDVVPGTTKELRVTPDRVGEYKVRCSVICGTSHAKMEQPTIVQTAADFQAWVKEQQSAVSANPVERGKKWATQFGCVACHSIDGSKVVGPTWKGLFGHEVPLADGTTVKADDAYLLESIINPNAKIVQGFAPNLMPPTYGAQLTKEQINDLIEYIKTIK